MKRNSLIIFGSRGRVGQAIQRVFTDHEIICLPPNIYHNCRSSRHFEKIKKILVNQKKSNAVVLICSGILNPAEDLEELCRVNFEFPIKIIQLCTELGIHCVSFGSIMENIDGQRNNYINCKIKLGQSVAQLSDEGHLCTHVQMHTLYGGHAPNPHMFLGQIKHSLDHQVPFKMTSGNQLREYHHVDDDMAALKLFVDKRMTGIQQISHGVPHNLRSIAKFIFSRAKMDSLLKLGSLNEPDVENYCYVAAPNTDITSVKFRTSLLDIYEYLDKHLQKNW